MKLRERLESDRRFRYILIACLAAAVWMGLMGALYVHKFIQYPSGSLAGQLPILCYHCVEAPPGSKDFDYLYVEPEEFRRQIRWLKAEGYRFLTPGEAWEWQGKADRGEAMDKAVLITFDDGYTDNYTKAFPIMKEEGAKATIFMVAGKIGADNRLTEEQLKEMAASGVFTIASHGYWHVDMTAMDEEELIGQLELSRETLSGLTDQPVNALAYPLGAWNDQMASAAARVFDYGYLATARHLSEETLEAVEDMAEGEDGAAASPAALRIPRQGVFGYMDMGDFRFILRQYFAH